MRRLWLAPFVSLWLWGGLGLVLPARAQPQRAQWQTVARITNYANQAGPTYYGGWDVPAPGPEIAACSWDLPPLAVVWIGGLRFVCWDRGRLGNGVPHTWIDTSEDYGLPDYAVIEVED